jgi:hypothetical protein
MILFKTECYRNDEDGCGDDTNVRLNRYSIHTDKNYLNFKKKSLFHYRVYFGSQLCDLMNQDTLELLVRLFFSL